MGRRKKCEQIKRTNNVMVRFTDAEYTYYKDYQKELRTACANVDSILGQHHIRDHIQRTEQTL